MSDENQPTIEVDMEEEQYTPRWPWSGVNDNLEVEIAGQEEEDEEAVQPTATEEGPSRAEILERLQRAEATNEALRQQADQTAALTRGLENLGEAIRPTQQAQTPQLTEEELNKQIDEGFYDSPSRNLDQYVGYKVKPIVDAIGVSNAQLIRRLAKIENPGVFEKYPEEVEKEMNAISRQDLLLNAAGAVDAAIQRVKSRHVEDTLSEELEKREKAIEERLRAELLGPGGAGPGTTRNTAPRAPNFAEGGSGGGPRPTQGGGNKVRITQEQADAADAIGMSHQDYAAYLRRQRMVK